MHLNKPTTITLVVMAGASMLGIALVDSKENTSEVLHSIFVALLVSCIFYAGTVAIPEIQRRKRIRNGLSKQYRSFKISCIGLFLIASNSQEYSNRENLLDHNEFRRYFSILTNGSQTRWDLVATSIDDGDYVFEELVNEFEFVIREINYARSNVEIYDDDAEEFFSRMIQIVHRLKATKPGTDDYKYFCRTLWSIFTRWDFAVGQREDDIIETMIERI
ncbi:MAG: hypothetical protein MN733_14775 [Nitrososphaera sp.]|nr:hypothetical protein [Nitrososphaera sp.]